MKTRKGLIAVGLLAALSTAAIAAGNYLTYSQVGEPSFCASTNSSGPGVGGTTGQTGTQGVCAQTVPAGPPALTGSEIVPADTNTGNGNTPTQTVTVPMPLIASGAYSYLAFTGTSATTQSIPNSVNAFLLDPTGTVSSLTLNMPTAPLNGQVLRIASSKTVSSLTLTPPSGVTISNSPTALTVSTTAPYNYEFVYDSLNTTWFRTQ